MSAPLEKHLMLPILKVMRDGKERHRREIYDLLDSVLQFSEEAKTERLASGGSRLDSRKNWSIAFLKAANLLERPKRGYYKITSQGQKALEENPSVIDWKFLLRYAPADSNFFYPSKKSKEEVDDEQDIEVDSASSETPLELIDKNHQLLKNILASDLLSEIKKKDAKFFEYLVVDLLLAMGYGGSREEARAAVVGKSHDGGIDGIIKEDKLGLDIIYLQAKRYDSGSIGGSAIRDFVGALVAKHASKGIFITTAGYSSSAREYVKQVPQKVILIDGNDLVDLMIEHNVGVSRDYSFEIKKIDSDYFDG